MSPVPFSALTSVCVTLDEDSDRLMFAEVASRLGCSDPASKLGYSVLAFKVAFGAEDCARFRPD